MLGMILSFLLCCSISETYGAAHERRRKRHSTKRRRSGEGKKRQVNAAHNSFSEKDIVAG